MKIYQIGVRRQRVVNVNFNGYETAENSSNWIHNDLVCH